MPSLADLFVTYKNVEPTKPEEKEKTEESDSYQRILQELQDLRERVAWLGGSLSGQQPVTEPETEENEKENGNEEFGDTKKKNTGYMSDDLRTNSPETEETEETEESPEYSATLADDIRNLFANEGIGIKITSTDDNSWRTNKDSYHHTGQAVDIVPEDGDYESLLQKMAVSEAIRDYFNSHGLGYLDERSKRSSDWTGPHLHIGPDKNAIKEWKSLLSQYSAPEYPLEPDLSSEQKNYTRKIYNAIRNKLKVFYEHEEGKGTIPGEDLDSMARKLTAQWATDHDFSLKGIRTFGLTENARIDTYAENLVTGKKNVFDASEIDHNYLVGYPVDDFINSILSKKSKDIDPDDYRAKYKRNLQWISDLLKPSKKYGGKFANIRTLYDKSFC